MKLNWTKSNGTEVITVTDVFQDGVIRISHITDHISINKLQTYPLISKYNSIKSNFNYIIHK